MTPQDLAARIRKLQEKATPGPWVRDHIACATQRNADLAYLLVNELPAILAALDGAESAAKDGAE